MKILFVDLDDAESAITFSGATSRILERLRLKHDIILLHKLNKAVKYVYAPYVLECKLRGLRHQLDRHALVARNYAFQVEKAYKHCRPDLVFSASTIPLAHLPAVIPSASWCDAVMPDMIDFYWPSAAYHRRSLVAGISLDKLALRKNVASIFSSGWAADGARKLDPEFAGRIHMVPFGANIIANPPAEGAKALPDDPTRPINFLFVGADWKRKGGQDSIDALKLLRSRGHNVRLSIVGATPLSGGLYSDFIRQFGFLRRDVDVENEILLRLYKEAHFFLLPTHAECSGIVFAEAASYGLPVIARDVGGVSSMAERNFNSILIGRNDGPGALAEAIRPLLTDLGRYRAMSEASLMVFARRLNWDVAVDRVSNILENAVGG